MPVFATRKTTKTLVAIVFFLFSSVQYINLEHRVVAQEKTDFNFDVAGDFGCDQESRKTIEAIMNREPELIIALGDLSYKKDPQCWYDLISNLEMNHKFRIALGEHDVTRGNKTYQNYLTHFNLTKPFYSFGLENIHFLVMATAKNKIVPYNYSSEQYQFVKSDLSNAHQNKKIDWIIVNSFRTFYSSNTTHPGLDELQDAYHPLFDKYHVDLVFQAHNHNYQRTFPLSYNNTKQYTPIVTDRNTEQYRDIERGQIFLTAGTGGAEFYNFTGQAPYVVKQFLRHGFLDVESTEKGSKLHIAFYDNNGIVYDQFSVLKSR